MRNKIVFLFSLVVSLLGFGALYSNGPVSVLKQTEVPIQLYAGEKLKTAVCQFKNFYQNNFATSPSLAPEVFMVEARPHFLRISNLVFRMIKENGVPLKECLSIIFKNLEEAEKRALFEGLAAVSRESQTYHVQAVKFFGELENYECKLTVVKKEESHIVRNCVIGATVIVVAACLWFGVNPLDWIGGQSRPAVGGEDSAV